MKWLRQQRKVDALSRKAAVRARQSRRFLRRIREGLLRMARRPETLAWAFAAGTLAGAGADRRKARQVKSLLGWANTVAAFWGLLQQSPRSGQAALQRNKQGPASPPQ